MSWKESLLSFFAECCITSKESFDQTHCSSNQALIISIRGYCNQFSPDYTIGQILIFTLWFPDIVLHGGILKQTHLCWTGFKLPCKQSLQQMTCRGKETLWKSCSFLFEHARQLLMRKTLISIASDVFKNTALAISNFARYYQPSINKVFLKK